MVSVDAERSGTGSGERARKREKETACTDQYHRQIVRLPAFGLIASVLGWHPKCRRVRNRPSSERNLAMTRLEGSVHAATSNSTNGREGAASNDRRGSRAASAAAEALAFALLPALETPRLF